MVGMGTRMGQISVCMKGHKMKATRYRGNKTHAVSMRTLGKYWCDRCTAYYTVPERERRSIVACAMEHVLLL